MRIAVVLTRIPFPLFKGDKLRAYYQIRELSKKHDVYLFCLNGKEDERQGREELLKYCKEVCIVRNDRLSAMLRLFFAAFTSKPLQVAFYDSKRNKRLFETFVRKYNIELAYFQFVRIAPFAEGLECVKVLDFQDTLSVNMARRAEKSNMFAAWIFRKEAKRLARYESHMFSVFDALTIITDTDRQLLASERKNEVEVIANGVDRRYFDYPLQEHKKYDLIFSGAMGYKPNIVAAEYLIEKIMPLVWERMKDVKMAIVGGGAPRSVLRLASEKVDIPGWVDDMRTYYCKTKLFVAPMQIGTGLQNKLLEAMAMSVPCITSPLANNALGAKDGHEIFIADSPQQYADYIVKLLNDKTLSDTIANNGRDYVYNNYGWEACCEKLSSVFERCLDKL